MPRRVTFRHVDAEAVAENESSEKPEILRLRQHAEALTQAELGLLGLPRSPSTQKKERGGGGGGHGSRQEKKE